jgi:hypothetical protein
MGRDEKVIVAGKITANLATGVKRPAVDIAA